MAWLILIGLLGGLVTGISPCILPVLPVVFAAGTVSGLDERRGLRRPLAIVAGLVISFSAFTLFGSWLLEALGLPEDSLRDLGIAVLVLVGLGLIFPTIGHVLERPFARLGRGKVRNEGGGFLLGLSLGVVYVPCAGPVLAAITVVGASHRIGAGAIALTLAFAVGAALPLLVFASAGQRLAGRVAAVRSRSSSVRRIAGVVLLFAAGGIAFNLTDALQRDVPGYATAVQKHIEGSDAAAGALAGVTGNKGIGRGTDDARAEGDQACVVGAAHLVDCGSAPEITGISSWLNTPGDEPLSLRALRGKVVLIDFWTYSCINCQRTLPHLAAWNKAYRHDGLVIVGVHTPEFAFEHVRSNVAAAAKGLGVTWPIALDNDYGTWNAYANQYWPAEYLIDARGTIRHVNFGEGSYGETEKLIRALLVASHRDTELPKASSVMDETPSGSQTAETYLGYERMSSNTNGTIRHDADASYALPDHLDRDHFAFGGHWKVGAQQVTAGSDATLELRYRASKVYLVLGGAGTVSVSVDGRSTSTVKVSGEPTLYTLVETDVSHEALLRLTFSPGVDAYAFTFG